MSKPRPRTVVVLAAGPGKRMHSALPKFLHPLLGRTLLGHVLAAAAPLAADRTIAVVGVGADQTRAHLAEIAPAAQAVHQDAPRGTGHAVKVALAAAPDITGTVVVLNSDVPLLRAETLAALVASHEATGDAATVLTAEPDDPDGLGRILRDERGGVVGIVEQRDATPEQQRIREINAGIYAFDAVSLRDALGKLSTDNDQGEEYLTDVFGLMLAAGHGVGAHRAADPAETLGCNNRAELAKLRALLRDRINDQWMRAGVTMLDPATTWVDVSVTLARDVVLGPNTQLAGATRIGEGAEVGPDTTVVDSVVGEGAKVVRAHCVAAEIGPECQIGPYAYLRPGTRLARKAKLGTYVETKNATIGEATKVPHLTYVGDATIGAHSNIGAATVFVNYDGTTKHHTVVGDHCRTGADNMFVAPVAIGDGAYTGAGTVVRHDVPPGALAVSGGPQRTFEGWTESKRPGTAAAEAAARARTADQGDTGEEAAGETGRHHTA